MSQARSTSRARTSARWTCSHVTGADSRANMERKPICSDFGTNNTAQIQRSRVERQLWPLFCCACVPGNLPRLQSVVVTRLTRAAFSSWTSQTDPLPIAGYPGSERCSAVQSLSKAELPSEQGFPANLTSGGGNSRSARPHRRHPKRAALPKRGRDMAQPGGRSLSILDDQLWGLMLISAEKR